MGTSKIVIFCEGKDRSFSRQLSAFPPSEEVKLRPDELMGSARSTHRGGSSLIDIAGVQCRGAAIAGKVHC